MTPAPSRQALYLRYLGINSTFILPALVLLLLPRLLKVRSSELAGHWSYGAQLGNIFAGATAGFGMVAARAANQREGGRVVADLQQVVAALTLGLLGLLALFSAPPLRMLPWPAAIAFATALSIPLGQVALARSAAHDSVRQVAAQVAMFRALPVLAALALSALLISRPVFPVADLLSTILWFALAALALWRFPIRLERLRAVPGSLLAELLGLGVQSGLNTWIVVSAGLFLRWASKGAGSASLSLDDYVSTSAVISAGIQVQSLSAQLQSPLVVLFARDPIATPAGQALLGRMFRLGARANFLAVLGFLWGCHLVLSRIYNFGASPLVLQQILWLGVGTYLRLCLTPLANGVLSSSRSQSFLSILAIEAVVAGLVGGAGLWFQMPLLIAAVPFVDAVVCWVANCLLLGRAGFQGAISQIRTDGVLICELIVAAGVLAATSASLAHRRFAPAVILDLLAGTYALTRLAMELKWMLRAKRLARGSADPAAGAA